MLGRSLFIQGTGVAAAAEEQQQQQRNTTNHRRTSATTTTQHPPQTPSTSHRHQEQQHQRPPSQPLSLQESLHRIHQKQQQRDLKQQQSLKGATGGKHHSRGGLSPHAAHWLGTSVRRSNNNATPLPTPWKTTANGTQNNTNNNDDDEETTATTAGYYYDLQVPIPRLHPPDDDNNEEDDRSFCNDSVSSLNDSVYFGGGASVTGGYSSKHPLFPLDNEHENSPRASPGQKKQQQSRNNNNSPPRATSLGVGVVPGGGWATNPTTLPQRPRKQNLLGNLLYHEDDMLDDVDHDDDECDFDINRDVEGGMVSRPRPQGRIDTLAHNNNNIDDEESTAVFTAVQSELKLPVDNIIMDGVEVFHPAVLGSPTAFQNHQQDINKQQQSETPSQTSRSSSYSQHQRPLASPTKSTTASTNTSTRKQRRCFCCREFFQTAPWWLKLVFLVSLASLVAAVVLLLVGLVTQSSVWSGNNKNSFNNNNSLETDHGTLAHTSNNNNTKNIMIQTTITGSPVATAVRRPTAVPTVAPSTLAPPTIQDPQSTVSPTAAAAVKNKKEPQSTNAPTVAAIVPPTTNINKEDEPSNDTPPQTKPTTAPTVALTAVGPSRWTIYLTAGPYSDTLRQDISQSLAVVTMSNNDSIGETMASSTSLAFLVHLGDWNNPVLTQCDESSFQSVAQLFDTSTVPVYFVVGDNEYNDCPDPAAAMTLWKTHLLDYAASGSSNSNPSWTVSHQGDGLVEYQAYQENFWLAPEPQAEVAVLSINLGDSSSNNNNEVELRHAANLVWIDTAYEMVRGSGVAAPSLFVFVNDGPPGATATNAAFYSTLLQRISLTYQDVQFVLVHKSSSTSSSEGHQQEFQGIANLDVVSVLGSIWPPLRMTVEFDKDNKRVISLDDGWIEESAQP